MNPPPATAIAAARPGSALVLLVGLALAILGVSGYGLERFVLTWGVVCAGGLLVARKAWMGLREVDLLDAWLGGFVYLYLPEGIVKQAGVARFFGHAVTAQVEGFTVTAFGATLIGYWLVTRRQWPVRILTCNRWALGLAQKPSPRSGSIAYGLALGAASAAYVVFVLGAANLFLVARGARFVERDYSLIDTIATAALTAFPILMAYQLARYKLSGGYRLYARVGIAFALAALLATGTRFLLGYAVSGVLYFALHGLSDLRRRELLKVALALIALLLVQALVLSSRSVGLANYLSDRQLDDSATDESPFAGEGLLTLNVLVASTNPARYSDHAKEHLFLLYWWVPRALWPDKPQLAGHWVIRELGTDSGFSKAHSVSGGFAFTPMIDFGFEWGAMFCVLYGWALGKAERFLARARSDPDAPTRADLAASPLIFGVFFMMRSPITSAMFLQGLLAMLVVPAWFLERRSGAARLPAERPSPFGVKAP